jgi:hypothetical protein
MCHVPKQQVFKSDTSGKFCPTNICVDIFYIYDDGRRNACESASNEKISRVLSSFVMLCRVLLSFVSRFVNFCRVLCRVLSSCVEFCVEFCHVPLSRVEFCVECCHVLSSFV